MNTNLRSGGLGGSSSKEAPRFTPPPDWQPKIIRSNVNGVSVVPAAPHETTPPSDTPSPPAEPAAQ